MTYDELFLGKTQSQASLEEQLNELELLAAQNGLYDAQDWIKRIRVKTQDPSHRGAMGYYPASRYGNGF